MSRRFFWLLEVEAGGHLYLWSTEDLDVELASGDAVEYRSGLIPPEIGQGDPTPGLKLEDPSINWPVVGPLLGGARCVLRRWQEGTNREQAEVYAKGTATDPEWGSVYDQVQFKITAVETLPAMPDVNGRILYETTPSIVNDFEIPRGQLDRYYPVIYGTPGHIPADIIPISDGTVTLPETFIPVVPCPMRTQRPGALTAELGQIVVSEDATKCLPSVVSVKDAADMEADLSNVFAELDLLGRTIGVADFQSQTNNVIPYDHEDEPEFLVAYGPNGTQAPRAAYDVIVNALQRWGGDTVDWARIPEIRDALAGYNVDTWIDVLVEGGVWSWLVAALGVAEAGSMEAAGLPIAIRQSAEGRYFVPLRYQVDPARTIRTIDVERGEASRVSSISAKGTPVNSLAVKFRSDIESTFAAYHTTITVGAGALFSSSVAIASLARYGRLEEDLEVPWTWDPSTAIKIANDRLLRDALPWRRVQYRIPEEWFLRESDQVRIIDPEVGLDEHAIIDGPPYVSADGMTVTLRMPGLL